ncbi:hypothetical protein Q9L58_006263 [Maublancomyces gigas]|uniref:Uncharacterized protein n=1 Tax=Discina gigas TaxID=1032678 RepID=A0ABR3GFZ6_9PEZI
MADEIQVPTPLASEKGLPGNAADSAADSAIVSDHPSKPAGDGVTVQIAYYW